MVRALPTAATLRDSSLRRLQRLRSSAGCAARLSRAGSAKPAPDGALAERALELAEEPFGLPVRALVGALVELAQEAALLVVEVVRHEDVDKDPLVAAAVALQDRHAAPAQDDDLARLRPRRQLELLLPVERRDRERGAERGLRERQVDGRVDVVAFAHESLVGTDLHLDIDVAGPPADEPGVPRAGQADLLAVVDPRRDLDRQRPLLDDAAGAATLGARPLDPAAGAGARRAGLGADELAENAPRHLLQPPGAVARRAGRDLASRFRAAASAVRAGHGCLERDLARHAVGGLDELDLHGRHEIGTARAATTTAGAEDHVVAEEGREEVGEVAEVDVSALEAAASQSRMAVAVVKVAGLRVREHLVGLDHLAEPLLGVRRVGHVGMELARELPESPLDVRLARLTRDPEQLVVVAVSRGHRPECS